MLDSGSVAKDPTGPPDPGVHGHGRGITGLGGRVEELGGHLAAGPRPDGGFALTAVLPIAAPEPAR